LIIPCSNAHELSNNIIQKGLAFGLDWSGSVADAGRQRRSEILPRRLVGRDGASVVRRDAAMNRTEDLDVKVCQKANGCIIRDACSGCKAGANDRWRREGPEGRSWLEAIARHRDASIPHWGNDYRDDEGNGLAAALSARFSCRRGAQAPQTEACLEES
jgi:hypothetical protein